MLIKFKKFQIHEFFKKFEFFTTFDPAYQNTKIVCKMTKCLAFSKPNVTNVITPSLHVRKRVGRVGKRERAATAPQRFSYVLFLPYFTI